MNSRSQKINVICRTIAESIADLVHRPEAMTAMQEHLRQWRPERPLIPFPDDLTLKEIFVIIAAIHDSEHVGPMISPFVDPLKKAKGELDRVAVESLMAGIPFDVVKCQLSSLEDEAAPRLLRMRDIVVSELRTKVGLPAFAPGDLSHTPDFRSVRWFGTEYNFTIKQADCVKALFERWENGLPEIHQVELLDCAESEGQRLRDVFDKGKHPAWKTMIVAGKRKGSFRLNRPPGDPTKTPLAPPR